jgi:hypothetical protein
LFARIVGVIEIVGDMCSRVFLFHFSEVVAVVEEDIMGCSIFCTGGLNPEPFQLSKHYKICAILSTIGLFSYFIYYILFLSYIFFLFVWVAFKFTTLCPPHPEHLGLQHCMTRPGFLRILKTSTFIQH